MTWAGAWEWIPACSSELHSDVGCLIDKTGVIWLVVSHSMKFRGGLSSTTHVHNYIHILYLYFIFYMKLMYSILYLPVKLRLIVYFVYPWLYGSRQKQCAALLALSGWLTCKYIYFFFPRTGDLISSWWDAALIQDPPEVSGSFAIKINKNTVPRWFVVRVAV